MVISRENKSLFRKATKSRNHHNISTDLSDTKELPHGMFTGCLYSENNRHERIEPYDINEYHWSDLDDKTLLSVYSHDASHNRNGSDGSKSHEYWPCTIISKDRHNMSIEDHDTATRYLVRLFQPHWKGVQWNEQPPIFLTNYPRSSIKFFNKPYSSDLHQSFAFRHYIEISDDIFPEHWRNKLHGEERQPEDQHEVGDAVEINVKSTGQWITAKIKKRHGNNIYDVLLQDGSLHREVSSDIIRIATKILLAVSPHPFSS